VLLRATPDLARRAVAEGVGTALLVAAVIGSGIAASRLSPGDRGTAWSGGSEPADQVNPSAVAAMAEVGIDISSAQPKRWIDDDVRAADVVVTMGCGDACPLYPGKRYEDWALTDPFGKSVVDVRPTRDEIGRRVRELLAGLGVLPTPDG